MLKWKAYWAGLSVLAVALVIAVAAYRMPVDLAVLSATEGVAFGPFPIMWIVLNAIWLCELTVASGRFEDLRLVIDRISDDPRIQAVIIALCFGGLHEALAGFGAPVAITGVMLTSVGFTAMRAAIVVLVANTAPVAFGAIATPIITAGTLTGIPYAEIGAMVGRQTSSRCSPGLCHEPIRAAITIGTWIAGAGAVFAFLSPLLGWLGTAVTGSDTSANALFATLQQTAGQKAGIDSTLLVAANTSGGVVGKMTSPQNLTIAATAVGLLCRESDIFRRVIWWNLGMLVVLCLLVGLQSTVLSWMLV